MFPGSFVQHVIIARWFVLGSDGSYTVRMIPFVPRRTRLAKPASAMACHTARACRVSRDIVHPKDVRPPPTAAKPAASEPGRRCLGRRVRLNRPMKLLRDTPTTKAHTESRILIQCGENFQVVVDRLPEADARIDGDALASDAGGLAGRDLLGEPIVNFAGGVLVVWARAASSQARPAYA